MTVEDHIRARVAEAPDPTPRQLARIALLLGGSIATAPLRRAA